MRKAGDVSVEQGVRVGEGDLGVYCRYHDISWRSKSGRNAKALFSLHLCHGVDMLLAHLIVIDSARLGRTNNDILDLRRVMKPGSQRSILGSRGYF